jgi:osomolarity two-component system, sensor histidine kinase SLN1
MSAPLFHSLRLRPNDHQPQDNPDAGLPPPALAMYPKAQGKPKKHPRSHGPRSRRGSGGSRKEKDVARPHVAREAEKDVEAQQSQSPAVPGKEKRTPLRVHWARFKKRIGTGSAVSDSLMDAVESVSVSATDASLRQRIPQPEVEVHMVETVEAEKRSRDDVQGKHGTGGRVRVDEEPVDEIVVDNVFLNGERGGSITHTASHPPSEAPHQNSGTTATPGTVRSGVYQGFTHSGFISVFRLISVNQQQSLCQRSRIGTHLLC